MLCLAFSTPLAAAEVLTGTVRVTDGDSIRLGGARVRLQGIDAPELDQTCTLADGSEWWCGDWSRQVLDAAFGGRQARCDVRGTDVYGRTLARCTVAGTDMGDWMVRQGAALAYRRYSLDYVEAEKAAIFANAGLWRADFEPPEDFREAARPVRDDSGSAGKVPPDPACPIKGNTSSSGKIYHVPGQADYDNTVITPAKGERWFCTEAEARAAGWRPARR